ncbi:uncharacterized protein J3R85_017425 [Psidium guajava]|nr:uncharacterized protein J3R85_017425 [Psidium guajava]
MIVGTFGCATPLLTLLASKHVPNGEIGSALLIFFAPAYLENSATRALLMAKWRTVYGVRVLILVPPLWFLSIANSDALKLIGVAGGGRGRWEVEFWAVQQ